MSASQVARMSERKSRGVALLVGFLVAVFSPFGFSGDASAGAGPVGGVRYISNLTLEELMDVQVVYGASRYEQKVSRAPAPVTIITADDIQEYGYRTLADVLRSVRSFYTTYDRSYDYVGVRGFGPPGDYNTRVLLLVDGHRINDNVYNQAFVGTDFPIDLSLVERIEVIRGPGSSLYGTSAFFAVINVLTQDGAERPGVQVDGELGSLGTYHVPVSLGGRTRAGLEYLLSGSRYVSAGQERLFFSEFDDGETSDGFAHRVDDDEATRAFAKLSYRDVTVQASWSERTKEVPTGAYGVIFNDDRNQIRDTRGYFDLLWTRELSETMELSSRAYYDDYRYQGHYLLDYSETDEPYLVVNHDHTQGRWWGAEAQLTRHWAANHQLALGAEYVGDVQQQQKNFDEEVYLDDERNGERWGAYAQAEITATRWMLLTAGLRHDDHGTFEGATHPRLACVLLPMQHTNLKLLYGTAYRAPNAFELYYDDGETQMAAEDLQPERIRTYEAALEHAFSEGLRATASVFHYRICDLITLHEDPDEELLVYRNLDHVETTGAEFEIEGRCDGGVKFCANYTLQQSQQGGSRDELPNSPPNLANLRVKIPLVDRRLTGALRLQYVGQRLTLQRTTLDSYLLTHTVMTVHSPTNGLDISGGIYNLFDVRHADAVSDEHPMDSVQQDGRTFRLAVRWNLR